MLLTPNELLAFEDLKAKIATWFSRNTAAFNRDQLNSPPEQFVVYADIVLTDMERVIREPSLTWEKILELLRKDYAFIVSVHIEPETGQILIEINREEYEKRASNP